MKKAFTLIELLISISIILLMAVVAIPAFDSYSNRLDTAAKAEEIKYIIEKAYSITASPENNLDGSMIGLRQSEDNVALFEGLYASECYHNINGANCRGWIADDLDNIFSHTESVLYNGYTLSSLTFLQDGSRTASNTMQIKFINEPSGDGVYICPLRPGFPESDPEYNCDKNFVRSELILTKDGGSNKYKITIYRHPFRVEVQKN